eukprot:COSAG01_NODE_4072_length_5381_cov_5.718856_3_plen_64_part_00
MKLVIFVFAAAVVAAIHRIILYIHVVACLSYCVQYMYAVGGGRVSSGTYALATACSTQLAVGG